MLMDMCAVEGYPGQGAEAKLSSLREARSTQKVLTPKVAWGWTLQWVLGGQGKASMALRG